MVPVFEIFGKTFSIYQIMALIGVFSAGSYACRTAKKHNKDSNDMLVLLLISAIGALLGMHLLYGLTNYPAIIKLFQDLSVIDSFQTFMQTVIYIFGGSVFYGGLLGGIAVGYIYCSKKGWDLRTWSDLVAPSIPFFHFFGRIGCFLSGCCFGLECSVGFVYQYSPLPEANGVVRFPIQLVEAAFNLILFFLLAHALKKGKCKGYLLCVYLLSYAPARFILEFFRGDTLRGIWWGLSTSQWISLFVIAAALVACFRFYKKDQSEAAKTGE